MKELSPTSLTHFLSFFMDCTSATLALRMVPEHAKNMPISGPYYLLYCLLHHTDTLWLIPSSYLGPTHVRLFF
jgi:hypothetical protein